MAMIKINLKGEYKTVQEGERVLEITKAEAKPSGKPDKISLYMKDVEDGATLINNYSFTNDVSMWAMGIMLNVALGIEDGGTFDTKDLNELVGVRLLCEVAHSEWNGKTYANVKRVIEKVENKTTEKKEEKSAEEYITSDDLD